VAASDFLFSETPDTAALHQFCEPADYYPV
jgi:hypothetical protein